MSVQIFVNLPVQDLGKSIAFFEALGFAHNPDFTTEDATSIVFSDSIYAMLLTHSYFKTTTGRDVAGTATSSEAVLALGVESRERVDELAGKALAAGATEPKEPQDHGFMYGRSFVDLDGHLWELFYMDPSAV